MIYPYTLKASQMWDRGEYRVEVRVPGMDRPVAYCDGTDEDIAELAAIAESEGADVPELKRKVLKTGREIWTMGDGRAAEAEFE